MAHAQKGVSSRLSSQYYNQNITVLYSTINAYETKFKCIN